MSRITLLLAVIVSVSSAYVYTCSEAVDYMLNGKNFVFGMQACVVIPVGANKAEYPYLSTTYLEDIACGNKYSLSEFVDSEMPCRTGDSPWLLTSDDPSLFNCTSDAEHNEILFMFSYSPADLTVAGPAPKTVTLGKGIHPIAAPEGSVRIDKKAISEDVEIILQYYTGVGQGTDEERFELAKEHFIVGTSTIILGPVMTIEITDDVTVDITVTSFGEKNFFAAQPGFEFSLMSSGMASDFQSTLPSILTSTAYGINNDSIEYDAVYISGTVTMDPSRGTTLSIECFDMGAEVKDVISESKDVSLNGNCSSLDITYQGDKSPLDVGRSKEVIILYVSSNPDPVLKPTEAPPTTKGTTTRRTLPPTSSTSPAPTTTPRTMTRMAPISTSTVIPTTSGASHAVLGLLAMMIVLFL